jgi:chorismate lyase/3-hydroxybenzoate synthase
LRTWNYIDRINEVENQEERYQTFCVARHEALAQLGQLELPHPAATAIGGHQGKNLFVFLFAKQAGRVIENKRQVSAWNYPKQYAPKQPRFSRAMQCGTLLMCSGTASVLGHKTIHLNDVSAQFEECLKNVSVLLTEDVNQHQIKDGIYRFYLREAAHTALIESKINELGIEKYSILHSDVCRENLLIECEVVFQ